jgi:hypothetical protein
MRASKSTLPTHTETLGIRRIGGKITSQILIEWMGAKCVPNCPEAKLLIDRKIIQKTIGKKKRMGKRQGFA